MTAPVSIPWSREFLAALFLNHRIQRHYYDVSDFLDYLGQISTTDIETDPKGTAKDILAKKERIFLGRSELSLGLREDDRELIRGISVIEKAYQNWSEIDFKGPFEEISHDLRSALSSKQEQAKTCLRRCQNSPTEALRSRISDAKLAAIDSIRPIAQKFVPLFSVQEVRDSVIKSLDELSNTGEFPEAHVVKGEIEKIDTTSSSEDVAGTLASVINGVSGNLLFKCLEVLFAAFFGGEGGE